MRWPTNSPTAPGRRLTRRRSYAVAGRLILAGLLPACAATAQAPTPQTPAGGEPPRLEWWTARHTPAQQGAVAAWNESHGTPLLEVSERAAARSAGKLAAAIGSGQPPALLALAAGDLTSLALANVVQPLDSLVRASGYDLKAFMPPALQPCYGLDGQLYALPEGLAITLLFFNRRFLDEAGIDYRQAGLDFTQPLSTWESFRELAGNLARVPAPPSGPKGTTRPSVSAGAVASGHGRWGFDPSERFSKPLVWCWQNGGHIVSDDGRVASLTHPANVDALEWLTSWIRDQGGTTELVEQQRTWGFNDEDPLLTGQLFAAHSSNRFLDRIARYGPHLPLSFAPLPVRRDGETPITQAAVQALALVSGEHVEAAWEVAQFLVAHSTSGPRDRATAAEAARHGWQWVPAYSGQLPLDRYRLAERPSGHTTLDEFNLHALEQARYARSPERNPVPRIVAGSLRTAFRRAGTGEVTELRALRDAQSRVQRELDIAWAALEKRA